MEITTQKSLLGGAFAFFLALSCCWLPLLAIGLGSITGFAAFSEGLENISSPLMGLGLALFAFGGYRYWQKKDKNMVILNSQITCPNCGYQKTEEMPTNACQYFYQCDQCESVLKPLAGDCCVYCSYGTVKCPPIQAGEACC